MSQQLYLNRAMVCVAYELTSMLQIYQLRASGQTIAGLPAAELGDFVRFGSDGSVAVVSGDRFRAEYARPNTLLAPQHAALMEGLECLGGEVLPGAPTRALGSAAEAHRAESAPPDTDASAAQPHLTTESGE